MSAVEHIKQAREYQKVLESLMSQMTRLVMDKEMLSESDQARLDLIFSKMMAWDMVISNHTQLAQAQAIVELRSVLKEIAEEVRGS